ncbi:unnamed protein product [Symbiodinium microadriaticum]|nr:unnamed protein product [Symbiodinium microadriaticum]
MAKAWPENQFYQGNYAPITIEADAADLIVTGEVPKDLHGALYRNGPNPQYAPWSQGHHWFLGDGMVHGFFIEDGKISYRNRWVQTEKFKKEREVGEPLLSTDFGQMGQADPRGEGVKLNVANTNILWHGGKLLALEEVNPPVAMNPDTLETEGPWTFNGDWAGNVTAHPKIDPKTGGMIFFNYMAGGDRGEGVAINEVDKDGRIIYSDVIMGPYASMIHDFIVTDQHIVLPIFPATIDFERVARGGPFIAWDPSQQTHIGILERGAPASEVKWFKGPPAYVYHPLNGWDQLNGSKQIVCDVMQYDACPLFAEEGKNPDDLDGMESKLVRWTFDLDGNSEDFKQEVIDDIDGDFPRFDERYAGLKNGVGYFAIKTNSGNDKGPFDTILGRNMESGGHDKWTPNQNGRDHVYVMEPIFVPREKDSAEGDGWLLVPTWDGNANQSSLAILNAGDLSSGPIAEAHLPHRVPYGFHGNWREQRW